LLAEADQFWIELWSVHFAFGLPSDVKMPREAFIETWLFPPVATFGNWRFLRQKYLFVQNSFDPIGAALALFVDGSGSLILQCHGEFCKQVISNADGTFCATPDVEFPSGNDFESFVADFSRCSYGGFKFETVIRTRSKMPVLRITHPSRSIHFELKPTSNGWITAVDASDTNKVFEIWSSHSLRPNMVMKWRHED